MFCHSGGVQYGRFLPLTRQKLLATQFVDLWCDDFAVRRTYYYSFLTTQLLITFRWELCGFTTNCSHSACCLSLWRDTHEFSYKKPSEFECSFKGSQLGALWPQAIVYSSLEFKLRYLKNLKLLSIRVKELFEPIVLQTNTDGFCSF